MEGREYHILIEKDEDGYYVADVPELPGCHTQAKSIDELVVRARAAIQLWLNANEKEPHVDFIGIQKIAV